MTDSTNPRVMADNIRELSDKQIVEAAEIVALQGDIEALGSYLTDEVDTGKKYGNNPIYRKVFDIQALPNNTTESFDHGVSNLGTVISLTGVMQYSAGFTGRPIPSGTNPSIFYNTTKIILTTSSDFSGNSAIIVFEYTKYTPTPDVLPSPDPDTRSLEEPERELETEPINEEPKKGGK